MLQAKQGRRLAASLQHNPSFRYKHAALAEQIGIDKIIASEANYMAISSVQYALNILPADATKITVCRISVLTTKPYFQALLDALEEIR